MPSHAFMQMTMPVLNIAKNSVAVIPDIGNISLLTSTQIDQRFQSTPPDGSLALATTLLGAPVMIIKRAGAWHTVSLTLI